MANTSNILVRGGWSRHRKVAGAPLAADSADLSLINVRELISTDKYLSIVVCLHLTGGTSLVLEPLFYDEGMEDFAVGSQFTLAHRDFKEVKCGELPTFFRIATVNGAVTAAELRITPSEMVGIL